MMASESNPRYFSNNHSRVFPSVCFPLIKTTIFREWGKLGRIHLKLQGGAAQRASKKTILVSE